ncbi:MAG: C40 family peptidase [Myxococcota bacterium]
MSLLPLLGLLVVVGPAGRESWRPPELTVSAPPPVLTFGELEKLALQYLGRPYVTGGVGSPGFDCSGLTCRVYAEAGYALPRVSRDQARAGRPVPIGQIQPGDLLFFAEPGEERIHHVGLYLGGGELLHAASGQGEVMVSPLSQKWYRDRLVLARRFLPDPGQTLSSTAGPFRPPPEVQPLELVEHSGDSALSPFLRRQDILRPPTLGPDVVRFGATSLALSALGVSESGRFGLVLVPEGTLRIDEIALEAIVAVPIRFEPEASPSVGTFTRAGDALRFLRGASLGLVGAELELRLSRFLDYGLGSGILLSRLDPGAMASGIQGLSIGRSPLSFAGGYRGSSLEVNLLVDDVVDPGVFGLSAGVPIIQGWLKVGGALMTDQKADLALVDPRGRRAITAGEVNLVFDAWRSPSLSLSMSAAVGLERALAVTGFGGQASVDFSWRFQRGGSQSLMLRFFGGAYGPGFVEELFGPSYLIHRPETFLALREGVGRGGLGGEASLRISKLVASVGFADAPFGHPGALDRRLFALVELNELRIFGTTLLDLRAAYAARAPFTSDSVDVLHVGARLRFTSWLFAEAYLAKTERVEGGAGLAIAWIP